MEGFTAKHPSGKEEWLVKRNGRSLFKSVIKITPLAEIIRRTSIIYRIDGKSLPAFHAEKQKAKKKGFKITNIDSTTKPPKRPRIKGLIKRRARTVRVFGQRVPWDEP